MPTAARTDIMCYAREGTICPPIERKVNRIACFSYCHRYIRRGDLGRVFDGVIVYGA